MKNRETETRGPGLPSAGCRGGLVHIPPHGQTRGRLLKDHRAAYSPRARGWTTYPPANQVRKAFLNTTAELQEGHRPYMDWRVPAMPGNGQCRLAFGVMIRHGRPPAFLGLVRHPLSSFHYGPGAPPVRRRRAPSGFPSRTTHASGAIALQRVAAQRASMGAYVGATNRVWATHI